MHTKKYFLRNLYKIIVYSFYLGFRKMLPLSDDISYKDLPPLLLYFHGRSLDMWQLIDNMISLTN